MNIMGKKIYPTILFSIIISLFIVQKTEAICVKEKRANLRKGPGLHYQILWEVFQYMPFKKIGQKGAWLRVKDLDEDIYWVFKRMVTRSYKCAVVKQNKTNLRTGPGTKYSKVLWSPVDKYFSIKVLEIKGLWVKVQESEVETGWIYRPLVWIQ